MNCKNCKKQGCLFAGKNHEMSFECGLYIGKTNADRIRAMSDEELADFLCYWDNCSSTEGLGYNTEKVGDYWLCTAPGGGDINGECQTCALSWLKATVEEVDNG